MTLLLIFIIILNINFWEGLKENIKLLKDIILEGLKENIKLLKDIILGLKGFIVS